MDYATPLATISRVTEYLGKPIPTTGRVKYAIGLEATLYELAQQRTEWLMKLHNAENQLLYPKDKEMTELDRKTRLNGSVSLIRRDYDFLVALEEMAKARLDFIKLLLTKE